MRCEIPTEEPSETFVCGAESPTVESWHQHRLEVHSIPSPVKVEQRKVEREVINHPQHYGGDTPYEVIKVLEAWGLDKDFCLGNSVKYIARAGKKELSLEIEDLEKSLWYLQRKIARLKAGLR